MFVGGLLIMSLFAAPIFLPTADATGVFSLFGTEVAHADTLSGDLSGTVQNSQQMPIVIASNVGPDTLSGDADPASTDVTITDAALTPTIGPVGNASDVANTPLPDTTGDITFYTVESGDTISSVATLFGITQGTLLAANGLTAGQALTSGMTLTILPVSGTTYTILAGDTIKSITAKFPKVDPSDITFYNDISSDADLVPGNTLIIPDSNFDGTDDAKPVTKSSKKGSGSSSTSSSGKSATGKAVPVNAEGLDTTNANGTNPTPITVHPAALATTLNLKDELGLPIDPSVGRLSQGIHGYNAVDIAAPLGTPIHAVADGTVLLARDGGYNDGYGNYVILLSIIDGHEIESIYAHQAKLLVTTGETVSQGDTIGWVGRTGDATGTHLHIEIRGAQNPFLFEYRK